jgi:hypothetical protein
MHSLGLGAKLAPPADPSYPWDQRKDTSTSLTFDGIDSVETLLSVSSPFLCFRLLLACAILAA